jgi:hypothetical protein
VRGNDECGMMSDELKGKPLSIHHSSFRVHHLLSPLLSGSLLAPTF